MSLLLNLINYSSSMQSEYSLSLPNEGQKDHRSRSLCQIQLQQQARRSKNSSKSLSKLFGDKPQPIIDPKTRILHRISHLLSIKCKKHYYALFVTLQTIKKKNLYLTPQGQFQKVENRKTHFSQEITEQKQKAENLNQSQDLDPKEKQFKLTKFASRIEQLQKLILIKEFQRYTKSEFFFLIKNNYLYGDKIKVLAQKLEKCDLKISCYRFIKKLKRINQYAFKLEILSSLICGINKKYNKVNPFNEFKLLEKAFISLKQFSFLARPQKNQETTIYTSSNKNQGFDALAGVEQIQTTTIIVQISQNVPIIKSEETPSNSSQSKSITNHPSIINFIQSQSNGLSIHQTPQFLISQPLKSLQSKINDFQKRKFQRNQTTILKSCQIKTSICDSPMKIAENISTQNASTFCNKLPKNYLCVSLNDGDQQFNTIFINSAQRNSFSSRLKESKVTPYGSGKFERSNLKNIMLDLNSSDQKQSEYSLSQISSIPMLKTDKSTNTIINEKSFNFSSAIGTECVNFKNSLVQERQSLKDTDKNFVKKKAITHERPEPEAAFCAKQFLRSTLQSKGRLKISEQTTSERKYSSNKESQLLIRNVEFMTETRPANRPQQLNIARYSSSNAKQQNQKRAFEHELQYQFGKVNMNLHPIHNIYPTRDSSGIATVQNSGRMSLKQTQKQNLKAEKDRSFIKLLSKKQNSFLLKN